MPNFIGETEQALGTVS